MNKLFRCLFSVHNILFILFWSIYLYWQVKLDDNISSVIIILFVPCIISVFLFLYLIKNKKMIWYFKDCFAVIISLVFSVSGIILSVINYNLIGNSWFMGVKPIYIFFYYIELSLIPWIIVNIYTFIRLKEKRNNM